MKKITRELPCTPVVDDLPTMIAFTGYVIGPLFVHRGEPDYRVISGIRYGWTVTHGLTGYAIAKGVRNKQRALRAAKRLAQLDCWDFREPSGVKQIPPETRRAILAIREAA